MQGQVSFKFKVKNEAIEGLNSTNLYSQSSRANFRPHWIRVGLSDKSEYWITRVMATRIWMRRRLFFSSSTKMDHLFQRIERAKQGLFSPASRASTNSVFLLTYPKKLLVPAHISDGWLQTKSMMLRVKPRILEDPGNKGTLLLALRAFSLNKNRFLWPVEAPVCFFFASQSYDQMFKPSQSLLVS